VGRVGLLEFLGNVCIYVYMCVCVCAHGTGRLLPPLCSVFTCLYMKTEEKEGRVGSSGRRHKRERGGSIHHCPAATTGVVVIPIAGNNNNNNKNFID
jgi:hypothetical protein